MGYYKSRRKWKVFVILCIFSVVANECSCDERSSGGLTNATSSKDFPEGFMIGCASAAYQVEGGWDADDKGENIWDHLTHTQPDKIHNRDNGDVACDSYHKYKEDVKLIKDVGFNHYRFSISWSRVLPTGHDNVINKDGLTYYHNLIDELKANGIEPMVTLYHWDLPQPLQELGGWTNNLIADYFEQYARVIFDEFASKVKYWITINEPIQIVSGYGIAKYAPLMTQSGVADYLAAKTVLLAHAKAYWLYVNHYKPKYHGKIGITVNFLFEVPLVKGNKDDEDAAYRAFMWESGMFSHPIFSKEGGFPSVMRERIDSNSKKEGRSMSRLPQLTEEEIKLIKGSSDFFGLNHYTSRLVTSGLEGPEPSMKRDSGVIQSWDSKWSAGKSTWLKTYPQGLRGLINWVSQQYDYPEIIITENGYSCDEHEDDVGRVEYLHDYMEEILKAIHEDGCNVTGYTVWSILDNFEWLGGYSERFGIYYVDFNDPERPRKKKKSVDFLKKIMQLRRIPDISSVSF